MIARRAGYAYVSITAKNLQARVAVVSRAAICILCNTDVHFAASIRLQWAELGPCEFRRTGCGIISQAEQNTSSYVGPSHVNGCYESGSRSLVDRERESGQVVRRHRHRQRISVQNEVGLTSCEIEDGLGNDRQEL